MTLPLEQKYAVRGKGDLKELDGVFFVVAFFVVVPVLRLHSLSPTHLEFSVQKGNDSLLPSVLQVIYCINQPASVKCMGSDYTIIHNTISTKHLSRPIHQSLIQ